MRSEQRQDQAMARYVYFDSEGIICNILVGDLTAEEELLFLQAQGAAFNAVGFVQVGTDHRPMIGGRYDAATETFHAPEPEPEPEPLPEPLPEPQPEPEI